MVVSPRSIDSRLCTESIEPDPTLTLSPLIVQGEKIDLDRKQVKHAGAVAGHQLRYQRIHAGRHRILDFDQKQVFLGIPGCRALIKNRLGFYRRDTTQ